MEKRLKMDSLGNRKLKYFWMAHLSVSLVLLLVISPFSLEGGVVSISKSTSKVIQRRETNPPFQFNSYSEEEATEAPTTIKTLKKFRESILEEDDERTTGPSSVGKSHSQEAYSSSTSSETEREVLANPTPTFNYDDSFTFSSRNVESMEEEVSAEGANEKGSTYTSLLSPLPQTTLRSSGARPFSAVILGNVPSSPMPGVVLGKNSIAGINRVGIRGLELERNRQNANSVVLIDPSSGGLVSVTEGKPTTSGSGTSSLINESLLRTARPTSSVMINNPSSYNRVVKRKKITSISGRNLTKTSYSSSTDFSDGTTTTLFPPNSSEGGTPTDPSEIATTFRSSSSHVNLKHNGSRAIAGFNAKGPSKIVTKTRPKPIIIRDHEIYLRNLTTEGSLTDDTTIQTEQGEEQENFPTPTDQPQVYQNVLPTPPHKVRKVKVPLRRLHSNITSTPPDISLASETYSTPMIASSSPNSARNDTGMALIADAAQDRPDYEMMIRPSPSLRHNDNPYESHYNPNKKISSKRVYKEEYGVHTESFDEPYPSGNYNEEEYDRSHEGLDHEDPMEVYATTEHYQSMNPPRSQFSIESSMNGEHHHEERMTPNDDSYIVGKGHSGTPKYRDYFSEVFGNPPTGSGSESGTGPGTGVNDNQNHLYRENDSSLSPAALPASVTVTVTKTVVHDSPPLFATASPNFNISKSNDHQHKGNNNSYSHLNLELTPTPALPSPTTSTFEINHDTHSTLKSVNQESIPVTTNSVEDINNSNSSSDTTTNDEQKSSQNSNNVILNNQDPQSNPDSNIGSNEEQIKPTNVISSKDITGVYFTKVEHPHFTSSSYEFTTSKHIVYGYGDEPQSSHPEHSHPEHSHHNGENNENHDEHELDEHTAENGSGSGEEEDAIEYLSKGQEINPTTSIKPFWNSNKGTLIELIANDNNNASASQPTPVVIMDTQHGFSTPTIDKDLQPPNNITKVSYIPQTRNSSHHEIEATEQNFANSGEEKGKEATTIKSFTTIKSTTTKSSIDKEDGSKVKEENKDSVTKPQNFPAMYQVPVLVKMELEIPQSIFCLHLTNFKKMIVTVYGERHTGVNEEQIVVYTEPNCTSTSSTGLPDIPLDFLTTPSSIPDQGFSTSKKPGSKPTTLKPPVDRSTKAPPVIKNDTAVLEESDQSDRSTQEKIQTGQKRVNSSSFSNITSTPFRTTSLKRKRRSSEKKLELGGESLILDRKSGFGREQELRLEDGSFGKNSTPESVLVFFFLNDKQGNYDQELTMAFLAFWNETIKEQNGSVFEGIFYQKIKNVNMITSSQLVSPEDEMNENSGIIAAITIASIAATCLFLIGVLLLVLRHRQAQTNFAKRCTPVTLDDYSLDNISFSNSFRRKQRLRGSKRSYTNAAFDDHTAPSRTVTSSTLHAALTDASGLESEFRKIPNINPTLDDIPQGAEKKNRYANVIPMPDTRVLLTFQEEQPNSDYINGNYVRGPNGEAKRYIITQGPLDDTTVDFWRMVWEQQVRVIFMITDFAEAGVPKCADYYPRSETIDCSQLHGDFQVTLEKRDVTENCITSYLVIKDMERNLRRDVIHLWYHSWPEVGVPAGGKPTTDFLLKARKFTKEPTPVLVHCSNGTGRSGTIVACDIAMKELETNQKADIPRILLKIRQDRAGSVQTKEQYIHIYEVLHYYSNRISPIQIESIP